MATSLFLYTWRLLFPVIKISLKLASSNISFQRFLLEYSGFAEPCEAAGCEGVNVFFFCVTTPKTYIDFFTGVRTSYLIQNLPVIIVKGKMIDSD